MRRRRGNIWSHQGREGKNNRSPPLTPFNTRGWKEKIRKEKRKRPYISPSWGKKGLLYLQRNRERERSELALCCLQPVVRIEIGSRENERTNGVWDIWLATNLLLLLLWSKLCYLLVSQLFLFSFISSNFSLFVRYPPWFLSDGLDQWICGHLWAESAGNSSHIQTRKKGFGTCVFGGFLLKLQPGHQNWKSRVCWASTEARSTWGYFIPRGLLNPRCHFFPVFFFTLMGRVYCADLKAMSTWSHFIAGVIRKFGYSGNPH